MLGDGTVIPRDTTHVNGWDYSNPTHTGADLYGPACTKVLMGTTMRLSIKYHCPSAS